LTARREEPSSRLTRWHGARGAIAHAPRHHGLDWWARALRRGSLVPPFSNGALHVSSGVCRPLHRNPRLRRT
jgi:hypothetical protein